MSVYSVRFNVDDTAILKAVATREHLRISEVIRKAIRQLAYGREPDAERVQTSWEGHTKIVVLPVRGSRSWTT